MISHFNLDHDLYKASDIFHNPKLFLEAEGRILLASFDDAIPSLWFARAISFKNIENNEFLFQMLAPA